MESDFPVRRRVCVGLTSWMAPALNYTLDACKAGDDICPVLGHESRCPCASGGSLQMCQTLNCHDPAQYPEGSCEEFVFATVRVFPVRSLCRNTRAIAPWCVLYPPLESLAAGRGGGEGGDVSARVYSSTRTSALIRRCHVCDGGRLWLCDPTAVGERSVQMMPACVNTATDTCLACSAIFRTQSTKRCAL